MLQLRTQASGPLGFAGLDSLSPCMIELGVAGIPAVLEPGGAASATAEFAGFLASATLGAYRIDTWRRRYGKRRRIGASSH